MSWSEHKAKDGRVYWYNKETKKSRWDKPDELKTTAEKVVSQVTSWKEYLAPDARKYWYNKDTKKSVWDMPAEYKVLINRVEQRSTPKTMAADQNASFKSPESADEAFVNMLADNGVTAKWSWKQVVKSLYKQPMYKALSNALERREAFEKYAQQSAVLEAKLDEALYEERSQAFLAMLTKSQSLTELSPFEKAQALFGDQTAWNDLGHDKQVKLFEQYQLQLQKTRLSNLQLLQLAYEQEISMVLEQIEDQRSWADCIAQNEDLFKRAINDGFQALFLKMFLYKQQETARQAETAKALAINQFRALLNELVEGGQLSVKSKWERILPLIENDKRYQSVSNQEEQFDLFIAQLEDDVYIDGKILQTVLNHVGFRIGSSTLYENYLRALDTSTWDQEDTKLIRWQHDVDRISQHQKKMFFDILHQIAIDKKAKKQGVKREIPEAQSRLVKRIKRVSSSEEEDGELSS